MFFRLQENIDRLTSMTDKSADFTIREMTLSDGTNIAIFTIEGMVNKEALTLAVSTPLMTSSYPATVSNKFDYIRDSVLSTAEISEIETFKEVIDFSMSGFAVLAIDGYSKMLVIGIQGFSFRGVSEPSSEMVYRGSREGFTEPLRINMTLVRRRLKTPDLVFKTMTLGDLSNTQICLCYIKSAVSPKILTELERRLKNISLDTVLASGYLVSYLTEGMPNIFSTVGVTEKPDTLCGKITEGRVGILVDGTPSAIIVPHLFIENFQSFDDYSNRPYYASFIRILKYISLFLALYFPGLFVAVTNFHPEFIPTALLNNINDTLQKTPFPLVVEVLMVTFMYEVMREAGLRLPTPLSHAVGIVGALVIGETGVSAGLISAPTLIFVAFSAICSYVLPQLYGTITILKFSFILAGGMFGFVGIVLLSLIVTISACSLNSFGVPYMSPISPLSKGVVSDNFIRRDWQVLSNHKIKVQNMTGAESDFEK